MLRDPDFCNQVPSNKQLILAEKAAERKTTAITFQDFVNVVSASASRLVSTCPGNKDLSVWELPSR